jgi:hypothetical protein
MAGALFVGLYLRERLPTKAIFENLGRSVRHNLYRESKA